MVKSISGKCCDERIPHVTTTENERMTLISTGRTAGLDRRTLALISTAAVAVAALLAYLLAHYLTGPHHHQFDLKIYFRAVNFWADGNNIYQYSQPDPVNISLGWTYPPLAAVAMSPMGLAGFGVVKAVTLAAIVLATATCVWLCLRERVTVTKERAIALVGLGTVGAFCLEPLRQTLGFGQVNMFLMLLVLADVLVLARRGSRWTGVGIGLAMAMKLTPGVFLLYFVIARQWRATVTAICTAVAATLFGAMVAPVETWQYFTSLMWESERLGFPGGAANQSLSGLLHRLAAPGEPSTLLWLTLVAGVLAVAWTRIQRAVRAGDTLAAITLTGFTGALISPVTWPHHIVWVIPAAVIIARNLYDGTAIALPHGTGPVAEFFLRLRAQAGLVFLVALGSLAWGLDLRIALHLPDVDFSELNLIWMLVASVQMFWVLAALFLLPTATTSKPALR